MKYFLLILFFTISEVYGQQTFNKLNVRDLDVTSKINVTSTTKSSKPCPAMTSTQRDAIVSPLVGSCVYNTTNLELNIYNGTTWQTAGGGGIENWLTATAYEVDDVVIESNKIYQCEIAHTSGTFSTDLSGGKWVQLANDVSSSTGILPIANGGTGNTSGTSTINANLTGPITSVGNATSIASQTGTGTTFVVQTSPELQSSTANGAVKVKRGSLLDTDNTFSVLNGSGTSTASIRGDGEATVKAIRFTDPLSMKVTGITADLASQVQFVGTEAINTWSTGNNATVMGGGTMAGTLAKVSSGQLKGVESYRYTQAGGSLNDYWCTPVVEVLPAFKNTTIYFPTTYTYNGSNAEILPSIYDVTNSSATSIPLNSTTGLDAALDIKSSIYYGTIPSAVNQVRLCYQVKTLNSGKVLNFTDAGLTKNLSQFGVISPDRGNNWEYCTFSSLSWQGLGTVTSLLECKKSGDTLKIRGRFQAGTTSASEARIPLPNNWGSITARPSTSSIGSFTTAVASSSNLFNAATEPGFNYFTIAGPIVSAANNPFVYINGSTFLSSSSSAFIFGELTIPISQWVGQASSVASTLDQVSSDTMTFSFKSTAIVDSDPVGTFNTYKKTANSLAGATTLITSAPTQTTSSMNTNGIFLTCVNYATAGSDGTPQRFDIKIGKNLKNWNNIIGYNATGKPSSGSLQLGLLPYGAAEFYGLNKLYNETTGILTLDCGNITTSSITSRGFLNLGGGTSTSSGYFVFNSSAAPYLASTPYIDMSQVVRAVQSSGQSISNNGTGVDLVWDSSETFDPSNLFVPSTGIFTAKISGKYYATCRVRYAGAAWSSGNEAAVTLYKNGAQYVLLNQVNVETSITREVSVGGGDLVQLNSGDTLKCQTLNTRTAGASSLSATAAVNSFSIYRVGD